MVSDGIPDESLLRVRPLMECQVNGRASISRITQISINDSPHLLIPTKGKHHVFPEAHEYRCYDLIDEPNQCPWGYSTAHGTAYYVNCTACVCCVLDVYHPSIGIICIYYIVAVHIASVHACVCACEHVCVRM